MFTAGLSSAAARDGRENGASEGTATPPPLYETLEQSFDEAVAAKRKDLEAVSRRLKEVRAEQKEIETRFNSIQFMIQAHSNMLLVLDTDIQSLEQAQTRQRVAADYIEEQIRKIREQIDAVSNARIETREQIEFYSQQLRDLRSYPAHLPDAVRMKSKLSTLIDILETKLEKLGDLHDIYSGRMARFKQFKDELPPLTEKIREQIVKQKQSRIFHHDTSPLIRLYQGELQESLQDSWEKTRRLLAVRAWQKSEDITWNAYGIYLGVFLLFLAMTEAVIYGIGRYCIRWMQHCIDASKFWQYLLVKLIQKSLPLAGAIAFLYFYPLRPVYRISAFFVLIPLIFRILALIMVVRWATVFLRIIGSRTEDVLFHRLYLPLRRLLQGVLVYGAGYFFISRVICYNCITLVVWRLIFEILLVAWWMYFFNLFRRNAGHSDYTENPRFAWLRVLVPILGYMLIVPGVVAELTGFGGLAAYWYNGVGKSLLVLFWGWILMRVLRESDVSAHMERAESMDVDEEETAGQQPYPVRWLMVRLLRVAAAAGGAYALLLAWGAPGRVVADIFYAVNYRITVGDFQLSLLGFLYALIVLLIIHTLSVVSKEVLRNRILRDTELETGLKESIARITGYTLWGVGILIALRVMGISGTSLTVVFGALGIGLGFGLQNIFNNFLSGIILLFERPIQVGDVIEIAGIWGTVKEINVRSTQVRTFDNADLIIPNADFISQRLTNWSFRDARVRRSIAVGVAYGSDIELVRRLLIEVAYKHPRILRRPHPDVLFSDFGESALIFKLRFWCHIDWFLIVETDVRFDIDRLFRENGITIPFPQRDLHLKTDNRMPVSGTQEQQT